MPAGPKCDPFGIAAISDSQRRFAQLFALDRLPSIAVGRSCCPTIVAAALLRPFVQYLSFTEKT
jgi:hypothetical protein